MTVEVLKLSPKPGDVLVIKIGPRPLMEAVVKEALAATEELRKQFPDVTFCFLPNEDSIQHIPEKDMNRTGWHRGERLTKTGKRFLFQGGRLKKR